MLSNALSQRMHQHDVEDNLLDPLVEQELIDKLLRGCSVPLSPCHVLRVPAPQCHGSVPSCTPPCLAPQGFVWALTQWERAIEEKIVINTSSSYISERITVLTRIVKAVFEVPV